MSEVVKQHSDHMIWSKTSPYIQERLEVIHNIIRKGLKGDLDIPEWANFKTEHKEALLKKTVDEATSSDVDILGALTDHLSSIEMIVNATLHQLKQEEIAMSSVEVNL